MPVIQEYKVKVGAEVDDSSLKDLDSLNQKAKQSSKGLDGLQAAAKKLQQPFVKLGNTIKKLFPGLDELSKEFNRMFDTLFKLNVVNNLVNKLISKFNEGKSEISKAFLDSAGGIKTLLKQVGEDTKVFFQDIGKQIAKDLAQPIKQLTDWWKKARKQFQKDMKEISRFTGNLISSFAKGVIQIVKGGKQLFEWFNQLPQAVKGATYAVLALWAVMKAGPVGQLMALVALIGDIAKDHDNYMTNKAAGLRNGDVGAIGVALQGIWDILQDGTQNDLGKAYKIAEKLMTSIFSNIRAWTQNGGLDTIASTLTEIVNKINGQLEKAFAALSGAAQGGKNSAFADMAASLGKMFTTLFSLAISSVENIGGTIVSGIVTLLQGKNASQWQAQFTATKKNPVFGAIGTGLIAAIFGADPGISVALGIGDFIKNALYEQTEDGLKLKDDPQILESLQDAGQKILDALGNAISTFGGTSYTLMKGIAQAITGVKADDWSKYLSEEDLQPLATGFSSAFTGALGAKLLGADTKTSVVAGLVTGVVTWYNKAKEQSIEYLRQKNQDPNYNPSTAEIWEDIFAGNASVLRTIGKELMETVVAGVSEFGDIVSSIVAAIAGAFDKDNGKALQNALNENSVFKGAAAGIGAALISNIFGGNWIVNLGAGLFAGLTTAVTDATKKLYGSDAVFDDLSAQQKGKVWEDIFGNAQEMGSLLWEGIKSTLTSIQTYFKSEDFQRMSQQLSDAIFGEQGQNGQRVGGILNDIASLWESIQTNPLYVSIKEAITSALTDAFNGLVAIATPVLSDLGEQIQFQIFKHLSPDVKYLFGIGERTRTRVGSDGMVTWQSSDGTVYEFGKNYGTQSSYDSPMYPKRRAQIYRDMMSSYVGKNAYGLQALSIFDALSNMGAYGYAGDYANFVSEIYSSRSASQAQALMQSSGLGVGKKLLQQTSLHLNPDLDPKQIQQEITKGGPYKALVDLVVNSDGLQGGGEGGGEGGGQSQGGRITSPGRHLIGEDGTEYVIPVTKGARSIALIQQMVTEMGGSARNAIAAALGLDGGSGTIGGSMASEGIGASGGMSIVYNNTVSAPVTINVNSTGTDANQLGRYVYSTAERALLHTLQGAVG